MTPTAVAMALLAGAPAIAQTDCQGPLAPMALQLTGPLPDEQVTLATPDQARRLLEYFNLQGPAPPFNNSLAIVWQKYGSTVTLFPGRDGCANGDTGLFVKVVTMATLQGAMAQLGIQSIGGQQNEPASGVGGPNSGGSGQ